MKHNLHTRVLQPDAIPQHYWAQIADLLNTHLHADFTPAQVVPYFRTRYDKFFILTDAREEQAYAIAGMTVQTIAGRQFIYIGALVAHPDYRQFLMNTLYRQMLGQLLRYRLRAFWQRGYIYGGLVSPIPYMMMAKYISTLTPSPARPTIPVDVRPLLETAIKQLYPNAQVDSAAGLVIPAHSFEATVPIRKGTSNRFLDFYMGRNPEYRNGVGLLFCIPVSLATIASMVQSLLKGQRRIRRTRTTTTAPAVR